MASQWLVSYSGSNRSFSKKTESTLACLTFDRLREVFLETFGKHIEDALAGVLGRATKLIPAPLAPQVEARFMAACGSCPSLPPNLLPVFHGTKSSNHASIFDRGLLVPDVSNGLRVVNGSAYGRGIYTTLGGSVSTSRGYCSEPRMLVCGLLDDSNSEAIGQHSWGRVVFDDRRVAPLFEAVGAGERDSRTVTPVTVQCGHTVNASSPGNSLVTYHISQGALRTIATLSSEPIRYRRPLVSRVTHVTLEKVCLLRRAARKRSMRKICSVPR